MVKHNVNVDAGALLLILGTFAKWLPEVALALPTVYYSMLIWTWLVNKQWRAHK